MENANSNETFWVVLKHFGMGLSNFGDSRAHFFEMIVADFYVYFLFLFFVWILCGIFVGREDPIKRAETCCEAKIIKLLCNGKT